jgi:hypothetical protein
MTGLIRTLTPLRDDALKVVLAGCAKQRSTATDDVIDVEHARSQALRHNRFGASFSRRQWQRPQILAVEPQEIERREEVSVFR